MSRHATQSSPDRPGHLRAEPRGRPRRRFWQLHGLLALIAILGVLSSGCGQVAKRDDRPSPMLIIDPSVGSDLEALALETWDQFLAVFSTRTDCFGDVRLRAAYDLEGRAGYNPDTATVTVQVPGTVAMLQSGLIHEWAHHVEYQCEAHRDLRPAFLAAQGLPPDTPWRLDDGSASLAASDWARIPSEQYAEATIELVLGSRPIPTNVRVTNEAVRVLGAWAREP